MPHVVSVPRAPFLTADGLLEVHQVPAAQDNLIWLLRVVGTDEVAAVDGPDAGGVLDYCAAQGLRLTAILKEAEIFSARVVDSSTEGFAIEATGDTEKMDEFIDVMRSYGEIEVTRSGVVAVSLEAKKLRLSPPIPTGVEAKSKDRIGVLNA